MPEYYKYVERDADSQINWAEVGKSLSDVLLETKRVREEKKDAIDQSIRESLNFISQAPQGVNQDVNNFSNNFASDVSSQMLLDNKLLKSGEMDLKKWTLRHQNYMDGTKQIFNLAQTYQDKSKEIMDKIDAGELQGSLGAYLMGTVEGFADFNNSRAIIDSVGDGRINLAKMEKKIVDGQEVQTVSNVIPVNVLLGRILNQPKKFDVEAATAKTAEAFGERFQSVYRAASTVGAGTITELFGIEAMKKYPQLKPVVDEMNKAINDQIGSYFAQSPLNLVSVLGENTGKYSSNSFTFDKNEAAKDPGKILLKMDPRLQIAVMDETSPNYKNQEKEAFDWVKTSLMSKLDSKATTKVTGQLSETSSQTAEGRKIRMLENDSKTFGEMAAVATTSNNLSARQAAIRYLDSKLQGTKFRIINNPDPTKYERGLYLYNETDPSQSINLTKGNDPDKAFKAVISGINTVLQGEDIGYIEDAAVKAGKRKLGRQVSRLATGSTRENISQGAGELD